MVNESPNLCERYYDDKTFARGLTAEIGSDISNDREKTHTYFAKIKYLNAYISFQISNKNIRRFNSPQLLNVAYHDGIFHISSFLSLIKLEVL